MEANKVFEGWQFGFREYFRMLVPGVGFLVLGSPYVSHFLWQYAFSKESAEFSDINLFTVLAVLFIGLIWFSMQIPKKMRPYRLRVKFLRRVMVSFVKDENLIDKPAYQYLVDCMIPPTASLRVHYFASYYYMFMDLALIAFTLAIINLLSVFLLAVNAVDNQIYLTNSFPFVYLSEPRFLFLIMGLSLFGLLCWKSALYFLDDVMQFSIFVIEMNKDKARRLSLVSLDSIVLVEYQKSFKPKPKLRGKLLRTSTKR